jgi:hypothetical protein
MVMKSLALSLLILICCCEIGNNTNQNPGGVDHPFMIYENKKELSNSMSITNLEPIPLDWKSLPPDDLVRLGIHQGDTVVKISDRETDGEIVYLGKLRLPLDSLKKFPKFTRYPYVLLEIYPPPVLYSLGSFFVLEGQLPRGWEYGNPECFYIVTPK